MQIKILNIVLKTQLVTVLLLFLTLSLYAQKGTCYVVDLTNPIVKDIPVNLLFSNINYIQLEHSDKYNINKDAVYYLSDEYIIVANTFDGVFAFERNTGKFIKQISKQGVAEDEYLRMPIFSYGYDEANDMFFFDDHQQWKGVNLSSNKVEVKLVKPKEQKDFMLPNNEYFSTQSTTESKSQKPEHGWMQGSIFNPWILGDGKYAGFVNNSTGNVDVGLVIFDKSGNVLKAFPNSRKYQKLSSSSPVNAGQFYRYEGNNYYKELFYNDTVFFIDNDELIPHIIFETGDKKLPYHALGYELDNSNDNKIKITFVQETRPYIFFNYLTYFEPEQKNILFSGFYDKDTEKTYVCRAQSGQGGFSNDLYSPISINPLYINSKEEILGVIPIYLLKLHFNNEHLSTSRVFSQFNMEENSNPIVVIMHLK